MLKLKAVITDIDGTITDEKRRLSTSAVETIRILTDNGVEVILASGNISCILKGLCKMIGTGGTFIGENGGVFRIGYTGDLKVVADRTVPLRALNLLEEHYGNKGIKLDMFSKNDRFADVAFARTVPVDEVRTLLADMPVAVLDTGFAIHLVQKGINKQTAFLQIANIISMPQSDFLAIGDSENDLELLKNAGAGACVANSPKSLKEVADYCATNMYGDGFCEIVRRYFPSLFH